MTIFAIFNVSCSPSKVSVAFIESQYTEDGRLIIDFWASLDCDATKSLVEAFNNSQGQYYINLVFKGSYAATLDAGLEAIKIEAQPSMLLVADSDTTTMLVSKNIYQTADDILSKYGNTSVASLGILPVIQSYYSEKGKLQSFPFYAATPVMIYNKNMLRRAGVDIDNMPQTFEDMTAVLQKLKDMGYVPLTASTTSGIFFENLSSMLNISIASYNNGFDNFKKARVNLSEMHLRTFEYLEDWGTRGLYKYYNSSAHQFVQGNVAIIFAPSSLIGEVRDTGYFDYEVSSMPYFAEFVDVVDDLKNSSLFGASIWALEGFSKEVYRGVAEFIEFVYSDEIMFEFNRDSGYLPITSSAYDYALSQGYYRDYPKEQLPYIELTKHSGNNSKGLRLGNQSKIRLAYDDVLMSLFGFTSTPIDAFDNYQTIVNHFLSEFEAEN